MPRIRYTIRRAVATATATNGHTASLSLSVSEPNRQGLGAAFAPIVALAIEPGSVDCDMPELCGTAELTLGSLAEARALWAALGAALDALGSKADGLTVRASLKAPETEQHRC